ncbi:T9SS type A sorting domain-containing protein [Larkinella terrae]|uniref:T9SS type A sorting domain-containing protein n=1 Tax=Larkinella terrae TaxID=2025311 RepID=A0A7K0ENX0_9BACT|nr:T9SS type A sorting domain-containing protein [Larkinella terrae]
MHLQLSDLYGRLISERSVEQAQSLERQTLPVTGHSAGLLLLRVSTPTQTRTVRIVKGN